MKPHALLALLLLAVACKRTSPQPKSPAVQVVLEPLGTQGTVRKTRDLSRAEAHLLMASDSAIGGPCLMAREDGATAFGVLRCPKCNGRMKLLAMVTDPTSVRRYVKSVDEAVEPPARAPPRGPPYWQSTVLRRLELGDVA